MRWNSRLPFPRGSIEAATFSSSKVGAECRLKRSCVVHDQDVAAPSDFQSASVLK